MLIEDHDNSYIRYDYSLGSGISSMTTEMYNSSSSWWTRFAPPAVRNLIAVNLLLWLTSLVLLNRGIDLAELFGLHYLGAESFRPYQLLTYQFLHSTSSFEHVLFNMFALFMFGSSVEYQWGSKRFLLFYLLCGITAGLTQEASWWWELRDLAHYAYIQTPDGVLGIPSYLNLLITVGASGSVFGILLACGMLFPNSIVRIYFILPMRMKYFVLLYGLFELGAGIHNTGGTVAHFAHLGGMLGGIILILLWRKKGVIR